VVFTFSENCELKANIINSVARVELHSGKVPTLDQSM